MFTLLPCIRCGGGARAAPSPCCSRACAARHRHRVRALPRRRRVAELGRGGAGAGRHRGKIGEEVRRTKREEGAAEPATRRRVVLASNELDNDPRARVAPAGCVRLPAARANQRRFVSVATHTIRRRALPQNSLGASGSSSRAPPTSHLSNTRRRAAGGARRARCAATTSVTGDIRGSSCWCAAPSSSSYRARRVGLAAGAFACDADVVVEPSSDAVDSSVFVFSPSAPRGEASASAGWPAARPRRWRSAAATRAPHRPLLAILGAEHRRPPPTPPRTARRRRRGGATTCAAPPRPPARARARSRRARASPSPPASSRPWRRHVPARRHHKVTAPPLLGAEEPFRVLLEQPPGQRRQLDLEPRRSSASPP